MTTSRTRVLVGLATSVAAGGMLLAPAIAHADGTKDPKYSKPPQKSQPKDDDGAAPLNNKRAPIKKCGEGWKDGVYSEDPSYYPFQLNPGTTSVTLNYDAYQVPDKFDILANGKVLKSTGWRGSESRNSNDHPLQGSGDGQMTVAIPRGTSKIEVRVTTDVQGTEWEFDISCVK